MRVAALIALFLAFGGNANSQEQVGGERILEFVAENRVGGSPDHWFQVKNAMGEWERVILVFGYADDSSVCMDLVDMARREAPRTEYRCVPAN